MQQQEMNLMLEARLALTEALSSFCSRNDSQRSPKQLLETC